MPSNTYAKLDERVARETIRSARAVCPAYVRNVRRVTVARTQPNPVTVRAAFVRDG